MNDRLAAWLLLTITAALGILSVAGGTFIDEDHTTSRILARLALRCMLSCGAFVSSALYLTRRALPDVPLWRVLLVTAVWAGIGHVYWCQVIFPDPEQ